MYILDILLTTNFKSALFGLILDIPTKLCFFFKLATALNIKTAKIRGLLAFCFITVVILQQLGFITASVKEIHYYPIVFYEAYSSKYAFRIYAFVFWRSLLKFQSNPV